MPKAVMRALARGAEKQGHRGATTVIVVILRDTESGQQLGINQEITNKSKWLRQRVLNARNVTAPGFLLLGMRPQALRKLWTLTATGIPSSHTPCSLRRGRATCWFQLTGSFDMVVDVGRWHNAQSCRDCIISALAGLDSEELETSLMREFAQHLT